MDVAEDLQHIDDHLAISTQDIATILGVPRSTIYAWRKDEAPASASSPESHFRLRALAGVATEWSSLSRVPLANLLRWPLGETTLMDLLTRPVCDRKDTAAALSQLARIRTQEAQRDARDRPHAIGADGDRNAEELSTDRMRRFLEIQGL